METTTETRITLADFGTGVLVGLAHEGYTSISVRGLDKKIVAAFKWLGSQAEERNLNLRFHINLDDIHGDAPRAGRLSGALSRVDWRRLTMTTLCTSAWLRAMLKGISSAFRVHQTYGLALLGQFWIHHEQRYNH